MWPKTETNAGTTAAWLEQPHSHHPRSVAVEVGFEPTEDLRLHTLSSTAHHRSPPSASVRDLREHDQATTGERWRTGMNETKTETTVVELQTQDLRRYRWIAARPQPRHRPRPGGRRLSADVHVEA